ncbi:MAG: hypothetical protein A3E87_10520 [Gammaproteobacteria bacterium RIFCSPHIGHO2_12_FULL_35_23]|nr:MAG: hypothetical protein A3E87_10520 [Gammaproteobacteria bacterium RIFCSPHIGHO2_12_FULL_35_23]
MFWEKLLFVLLAVMLIWLIVRLIKANPGSFTLQNLNKSFYTMGILALLLIGFIAALVWMLGKGAS